MPETRRASWQAEREDRMRILSTLKRLVARPPSPWPVLSVYVNTRPVGSAMTTYRPFLKKRMTEELKALKARSPEHESLAVDFARAQHYLDYDLRDVTRSVAVFASYADEDMFDAVQLPVEFAGSLSAFVGFTQLNVRLPDGLSPTGDLRITITVNGQTSNVVLVAVKP